MKRFLSVGLCFVFVVTSFAPACLAADSTPAPSPDPTSDLGAHDLTAGRKDGLATASARRPVINQKSLTAQKSDKMPPLAPPRNRPEVETAPVVEELISDSDDSTRIGRPAASDPTRIQRPGEGNTRISRPLKPGTTNDTRISRPGTSRQTVKPAEPKTDAKPVSTDATRVSRPSTKEAAPSSVLKPGIPQLAPERQVTKNASPSTAPSTSLTPGQSRSDTTSSADGKTSKPKIDQYPAIGKLEQLTFGKVNLDLAIEDRLLNLENAVFAKTYPHDSLFDRSERLKNTLLGTSSPETGGVPYNDIDLPPSGWVENPLLTKPENPAADLAYLDEIAEGEDGLKAAPKHVLNAFAVEMINFERQRRALGLLEANELVQKMADEHIIDLAERGIISHFNEKGENPDRRYTKLGGVDAVSENLASLNTSELGNSKLCKAAVAKILKQMLSQQDDREALLAPEATHIGFSLDRMAGGSRIIACSEILTTRGVIHPVPKTAHIGDKVEVSGIILKPYQFDRISLAWEGTSDLPPQEESVDEPLPYFPPLDFVAYREKSERDFSKAIFALKTVGMLAAIAGGVFVPPVALAAPLIIMSGPDPSEPKPVSDIPIKGGVKVTGGTFNGKVTISNDGKEGLYYLTVWANLGEGEKPVAVSRRTISVKRVHEEETVSGNVSTGSSTENAKKETELPKEEPKPVTTDKTEEKEPAEKVEESKPVEKVEEKPSEGKVEASSEPELRAPILETEESSAEPLQKEASTTNKQERPQIEYTKENDGKVSGQNGSSNSSESAGDGAKAQAPEFDKEVGF